MRRAARRPSCCRPRRWTRSRSATSRIAPRAPDLPDPRARPRRIAVIGRSGSGKSTAAVALGAAFDLPVVHLDQLYWTSDWEPVGLERYEALHDAAIAGDSWVLDGGYMSEASFARRAERADLFVITTAPLPLCLYRVVARSVTSRGRDRAGRPVGANEKLSVGFLLWIIRWGRNHPSLENEVRAHRRDVPIVVVRDRGDLARLIAT